MQAITDANDGASKLVGPRERLTQVGAEGLSEAELLALLISTGTRGRNVHELAQHLLATAGGLTAMARLTANSLAQVGGVGRAKASRIVAAFELGRRLAAVPLRPTNPIHSSRDIDAAFRPRLGERTEEVFLAVALDAKFRPISECIIAQGGSTTCSFSPADVYRTLIRDAAVAVVFVHNHPSGVPDPSPDDLIMTQRLLRCGHLLGVEVVDHVIIGREGYFSFKDAKILG